MLSLEPSVPRTKEGRRPFCSPLSPLALGVLFSGLEETPYQHHSILLGVRCPSVCCLCFLCRARGALRLAYALTIRWSGSGYQYRRCSYGVATTTIRSAANTLSWRRP